MFRPTATLPNMTLRSVLRHRVALILAGLVAVACVVSSTTRGHPVALTGNVDIQSPLKAHMRDGSIVVYARGATIGGGQITGRGMRYDATLQTAKESAPAISIDSVVGVESYEREINEGRTLLYSTLTTAATVIGGAALAIIIFGSCPTIYADSVGTPVLQAESFSYSVAPLLAKRDVDRLHVTADGRGIVRLEVRNEALETHYLDQLELLEVRHARDELIVPAARAGLVAVRGVHAPTTISDRAGRDLSDLLERADERVFSTDSLTLARAARGDSAQDHIDIVMPKPAGRDSVAVVMRARSSLLTTTLFYDEMLAGQGASALDYVGHDLQRVTKVAQLANWYVKNLGLRVSLLTDHGHREHQIVRLVDFGPTAWRDVAAIVPVEADGDSLRIRLTFLADEFRIDQVQVSSDVRPVEPRAIPVARVTATDGAQRTDARDMLLRTDGRDLQTWPGQRFFVDFDVGPSSEQRTYFLAAEGYYTEWMRGSWLRAPDSSRAFAPWSQPIAPMLRHWLETRDSLESSFFRQRAPIV
jgi:hypothetical protein